MIALTAHTFRQLYQQIQWTAVKSQKELLLIKTAFPPKAYARWRAPPQTSSTATLNQPTRKPSSARALPSSRFPWGSSWHHSALPEWQFESILMKTNPENKALNFFRGVLYFIWLEPTVKLQPCQERSLKKQESPLLEISQLSPSLLPLFIPHRRWRLSFPHCHLLLYVRLIE